MSRTVSRVLVTAAAALALAVAGSASAAPAAKTVTGTVGPGFTITMKLAGKQVKKLKAGVPYKLVVNDLSEAHNYHLTGPGYDRVLTSVPFTGKKTITVKFKKGTYTFVCDPHASSMKGSFTVA
jgi:plastocyanin